MKKTDEEAKACEDKKVDNVELLRACISFTDF